ncbi:hypothetical protein QFC19_003002 [Naganishia cerealis]|uniref:Uncharacterized protein n=1 Tax=Naganishia cerealis TaxID=610337 RepID=A0ACC2W5X5_9TREE|nr:hypothetical protein QFC19_003002 [Naganishia cerealis]
MSLTIGSRTTAKGSRSVTSPGQQASHQGDRRGNGWDDVWDSSSDPEDATSAKNAKTLNGEAPSSEGPVSGQALRSSSYTHISPPSPSSYGPRNDWTVLDETEITEAEKIYEAERQKRLHQKENQSLDPNTASPYTGTTPTAFAKTQSLSGSNRSFGSGVAGLSKSFINIALGSASSQPPKEQNGKGKEKEKEIWPSLPQRGISTSSKRQTCGRDAIRPDIEEILRDPVHILKDPSLFSNSVLSGTSTPVDSALATPIPQGADICYSSVMPHSTEAARPPTDTPRRTRSIRSERRREKFAKVLSGKGKDRGGSVDSAELRRMAWSGIPEEFRHIAWQMLLNYLPLPSQPRLTTLARKRREYAQLVEQAFGRGMTPPDAQIWHQIEIDVPRTRPGVPLWSCEATQRSLERILYVRAMRNPASGYVQGINDLVTPFFEVFLGAYITCDPELFDVTHLPGAVLAAIEADSFWCLSKLLDGIQDNYITAQPGIHRLVRRMAELVKRIDSPLALHLEEQGVEFMQFAFRWMNCLLMREISVKCTIRMWDTYLAEGTDAFSQFHLYVCSAFLVKWSDRLKEMDFQEIIMFLQCLPTQDWQDHDIELLLSEAFVLKSVWQGAENHFTGKSVSR